MFLALNNKSVKTLMDFAEAMPIAIQDICDDTEELMRVYQRVSENVGVHGDDFHSMLLLIQKAQKDAAQAIEVLPHMLIETAVKIEKYVGKSLSF